MSTKVLFQWLFIILVIGIVMLLLIVTVPAQAQCDEPQPSSCASCHAHEDPINKKGEWHIIHAGKDICINCHGGNGTATEKYLAHEALTAHPLDDIYTDCHGCHSDYDERAARFASTLGVTPGSCVTPTSAAVSNIPGEPPSGNINISTNLVSTAPSSQYFLVISVSLLILTFFLIGLRWLEQDHTRR
jgi:hypothetical protein